MGNKKLELVNGIPRMVLESSSPVVIYDETVIVSSDTSAGVNFTLPSAKTYDSEELEIYLNDHRLDSIIDYNYVGVVPRTTVVFTFDLVKDDVIRYRIDRTA